MASLFLLKLMMAVSIFSVRNTLRRSDTPPHLYSNECGEGEVMFVLKINLQFPLFICKFAENI